MILVLLALILAGCLDVPRAPTPEPEPPNSGNLQLALSTAPDPPTAGPATIIVEVKDTAGQPVEGAQVNLSARMENMNHGSIRGQLADKGAGRYEGAGSFVMGGPWRITIAVDKAGLEQTVKTFELQVR